MRVDDAKRWLKILAEKEVQIAPLFVGPMGIGKSDIVKQVTNELGLGFIDLRLAQMEPGDLIGIPYRDGDRTCWAKPEWFPKDGTKGILHLDECNRAPNDVRQAVFQLIWDRKLHRFTLPDGWLIVSSINPSSNGEYQVEELDRAFLRRFCVLLLNPTVDSWMGWANREGKIANDITGFIGTHKDMLFEPETFELPVKRNPAGWSEVNKCRNKQALPQDLEFEIISGFVGKEAATAFIKYLDANYERPVNGEEVLNNYKDVREKILKQRKKSDEMYVTIKQIIGISEAAKKLTKKQMENLVSFIDDLNADTAAMLVHEMPSDIIDAVVKEGQKNGDDRILKVGKASRSAREEK
jgi:hypothetical protein